LGFYNLVELLHVPSLIARIVQHGLLARAACVPKFIRPAAASSESRADFGANTLLTNARTRRNGAGARGSRTSRAMCSCSTPCCVAASNPNHRRLRKRALGLSGAIPSFRAFLQASSKARRYPEARARFLAHHIRVCQAWRPDGECERRRPDNVRLNLIAQKVLMLTFGILLAQSAVPFCFPCGTERTPLA
jgi:hypothetical protein